MRWPLTVVFFSVISSVVVELVWSYRRGSHYKLKGAFSFTTSCCLLQRHTIYIKVKATGYAVDVYIQYMRKRIRFHCTSSAGARDRATSACFWSLAAEVSCSYSSWKVQPWAFIGKHFALSLNLKWEGKKTRLLGQLGGNTSTSSSFSESRKNGKRDLW